MVTPRSSSPFFLPMRDDATKGVAFQRTLDVLRDLDKIRCAMKLPPEALAHVLKVYTSSVHEAAFEAERAVTSGRLSMMDAPPGAGVNALGLIIKEFVESLNLDQIAELVSTLSIEQRTLFAGRILTFSIEQRILVMEAIRIVRKMKATEKESGKPDDKGEEQS